MKISNETKIGALTAISITLLILGFNFLKGKNLFQKKATMYITFKKVEGLNVSDAIKINGLRVGAVRRNAGARSQLKKCGSCLSFNKRHQYTCRFLWEDRSCPTGRYLYCYQYGQIPINT